MTVLQEIVEVPRAVEDVFAYISDFTTTAEWDSTVLSARKLTPGPIDLGTQFEVVCALPLGSVTLLYTIKRLLPHKLVELSGSSRFFDVLDTISLTPTAAGTRIDYRAQFTFKPLVAPVAALSAEGLQRMGRESVVGLERALRDQFHLQETPRLVRAADRLVLPGVSLFSRLGYSLARKRFNPVSANVRNRHIMITGASAGLGYAAALELARRGAELTLVMRDRERARSAVEQLQRETGNTAIRFELADLSLMAEVDALVARMKKRGEPLDVLINNAGALFNPRAVTAEGLEQSFALLLLSPYRLTEGLKPLLAMSSAPRVINVVSGGMYSQQLQVDQLQMPDTAEYSGSVAYARQKRALMVLTQEWAAQWQKEGIVVNAMHPGWADTPGVRSALPQFRKLTRRVLRSSQEGADTIVWLAAATEAGSVSGKLFLDREVHTTHLLGKTRETPQERAKLMAFLRDFKLAPRASRKAARSA
jgi:NAD(P)-dependent dehydrogenase (short-subunit alcohol dehydrogenase family)